MPLEAWLALCATEPVLCFPPERAGGLLLVAAGLAAVRSP
jgi:hypothetical protein